MTFFRRGRHKQVTLEKKIFRLIRKLGPLDCSQICVELVESDEEVRKAIFFLVNGGILEARLDPGQSYETTTFMRVPWVLASAMRKQTQEQRKKFSLEVLDRP